MFTVEIDWDETALTFLDDTGRHEDISVYMYEDVVYIRQWIETEKRFHVLSMTPKMLQEFRESFSQTEGAYQLDIGYQSR